MAAGLAEESKFKELSAAERARQAQAAQWRRRRKSRPAGSPPTRTWLTAFAPRSTDLIGSVIKVHGRMTAAARRSGNNRVLSIHANYPAAAGGLRRSAT
jgi:hypothetical protein